MADAGQMIIAVGSDHRGVKLKEKVVCRLLAAHHRVKDYGAFNDEPVDYPAYAFKVGECVAGKKARFGILICHTGNGMAIAANKISGVRAAICPDPVFAGFARSHNDANVMVIPAGFIKTAAAFRAIDAFIKTRFEGGRHRRRVGQILRYEQTRG